MFKLVKALKIKRILRFYFSADSLERTLDGLIMKCALNLTGSCAVAAEKICALIGEKSELSRLWNYVDGIINGFTEDERLSLKTYALMRCGIKTQPPEIYRGIKRAAVKLTRRARRLDAFPDGLRLVNDYYCILGRDYLSGRK